MKFKILSWNVENLFHQKQTEAASEAAYRAKLTTLAAAVREMNPDVLALQESGGPKPWPIFRRPSAAPFRTRRCPRTPTDEASAWRSFPNERSTTPLTSSNSHPTSPSRLEISAATRSPPCAAALFGPRPSSPASSCT
jgi:hypothetical protein